MDTAQINNANLMDLDWGAADRQSFIRSVSGKRPAQPTANREGATWMTDVSASDRRSVKSQLGGRFSARVAWWQFFSTAHQLFSRSGSLESAMYDFHRMHHAVTYFLLKNWIEWRDLTAAIMRDGALPAMRAYLSRLADEIKGAGTK